MSDPQIAALLAERDSYVARKLPGRVAEVDAALAALGYKTEKATEAPVVETATKPAPRTRKAIK